MAKRLNLPSEPAYWSKGVTACAICDGAAPIFRDEPLAVVGGGDSAAEEAVYLTKYSPQIHLLVRSGQVRWPWRGTFVWSSRCCPFLCSAVA